MESLILKNLSELTKTKQEILNLQNVLYSAIVVNSFTEIFSIEQKIISSEMKIDLLINQIEDELFLLNN